MTSIIASSEDDRSTDKGLQIACIAGAGVRIILGDQQGKIPEEIAQDLAWDAYDEPDPDRAIALALQATAIDVDCVDAAITVATLGASSPESEVNILRAALLSGEKRLGRKFFRENAGHFWGLHETRPYMRARFALAEALEAVGQIEEAISHCQALLELNPNDNQGAREFLLRLYFCTRRIDDARRLLERYREDPSAIWSWARVLEKFISSDIPAATQAMAIAKQGNPYVLDFLTGRKKLPRALPPTYSLGGREEALICAHTLFAAWRAHPAALKWLQGSPVAPASGSIH